MLSKDLNKIISELDLKKIALQYTKDLHKVNDVVQETYLYLLEIDSKIIEDIYNKDGINGLLRYSAIIIKRALNSTRSKFYYKYRKYYTKIDDSYTTSTPYMDNFDSIYTTFVSKDIYNIEYVKDDKIKENLYNKVEKELNNMYWYDREIFKLYYLEEHTLNSLQKTTGISRNSLHTTIKKVRELLRDLLNE